MRYIFSEEIRNKIVTNKIIKESNILELLKEYSIEYDFYQYRLNHNDYKQQGISFKQLIYHFLMDDSYEIQKSKCLYCGNTVDRFYSHKMEYAPYCCKKCSDLSPIKHQHEQETHLKKYGKKRWTNREMAKKTCQRKYGKNITNPSQVQSIKEKKKETTQMHYGVDNPGQIYNHNEKCKCAWNKKTEKEKNEISENRKLHTDYNKRKIKTIKTIQQKYGKNIINISQVNEIKEKKSKKKDISVKKARETIKKNFRKNYEYMKSSYNFVSKKGGVISNIELNFYEYLIKKFGQDDIIPQYSDDRYPFSCDFYIKSIDLFIEIQGSWTHGGHKFNEYNQDDINKLKVWKSKNSKYYESAIDTWSHRDVKKRNIAKDNNINYLEIFTKDIDIAISELEKYLLKK